VSSDSVPQNSGRIGRHNGVLDIVGEREHRHGRTADGKAGSRHHRRDQPFKALAGLGQFRRDPWGALMHFHPNMVSDEAHNAFAIFRRDAEPRIFQATGKPVDPEFTIGIEHHLADGGIIEIARNSWPQCGAHHTSAACECF